jgi:lysyl-tRNA synthetase class I
MQYKAWPFIEAQKVLNKIKRDIKKPSNNAPQKHIVKFETGYGPSGLPHIGTFCEVFRTSMIINALKLLLQHDNEIDANAIEIKLICFSDDIDGLKKIPSNIPNQIETAKYIGQPLTSVPDPFGLEPSYGAYMNKKLRSFLDAFGLEYEFMSATQCYKSGFFDESLKKVLEKYDALMDIMLPTLGEERQKTYSPFLPICKKTNKVLQAKVTNVDVEKAEITYIDDDGSHVTTSVLSGNCKLQWKVDFGMRWMHLGIDFEMYGKDHRPNSHIYSNICKTLGGVIPIQYFYELFLDEEGNKVSKSKGNSISIDEWLQYTPIESVALYAFQTPERAKRLYFDVIPKITDEYMTLNKEYIKQRNIAAVDASVSNTTDNRTIATEYAISAGHAVANGHAISAEHAVANGHAISAGHASTDNRNAKQAFESKIHLFDNPIYLIHNTLFAKNKQLSPNNVPEIKADKITFALLLNLAAACNTENKEIMWGFIKKYSSDVDANSAFIDKLIDGAIVYYNNFIKPNKNYLKPDAKYIKILQQINEVLTTFNEKTTTEEEIQNAIYTIGKQYYDPKDLRIFFSNLYQILLGQKEGPRFGSFIKLFSLNKTSELIINKISTTTI